MPPSTRPTVSPSAASTRRATIPAPPAARAGAGRAAAAGGAGPVWNWTFDAVQVGEDYNPEAGFLLRSGVRRYYPNVIFEPRPKIAGVRNLHFGAAADLITDLDNRIESRALSADVAGVRFQSEDQLTLFVDSIFDRVPEPFAIGPGVTIEPGSTPSTTLASAMTPTTAASCRRTAT